jgi:hypothetical protein
MGEDSQGRETEKVPGTVEDRREEYQPPKLKDLGNVTELTKTSTINPGADGLYS